MQTTPTEIISLEDLEAATRNDWTPGDEFWASGPDEWTEGDELLDQDQVDIEQLLAETPPPALKDSLPLAIGLCMGVIGFLAWVIL